MSISKVSAEDKLKAVKAVLAHEESPMVSAKRLGVHWKAVQYWVDEYIGNGPEVFNKRQVKSYSADLKIQCVEEYLKGETTMSQLVQKYGLKSSRQIRDWLKKYNSHEELKSSGTGGAKIMTKARQTTFDERVEIVKYCIENGNAYHETAEKFKVSYQQVRNYVLKYNKYNTEGLIDGRGHRKPVEVPEEAPTEYECMKAELKLANAKLKAKDMEIDFLKNSILWKGGGIHTNKIWSHL